MKVKFGDVNPCPVRPTFTLYLICMKSKLADLISGLSLGSLVGIMIGLSISQVVGLVLGALTSLLVAFFGLKEDTKPNPSSKLLIGFFSISCLIFILIGIYLRNHNALAPTTNYYKEELSELHLDTNSINKIILLKKFGLTIAEQNETAVKYEPKAEAQTSTSLFSSPASQEERELIVERFEKESYEAVSRYLKNQGPLFDQFINSIEIDVPDTTIRKRIALQLIAITYKR